MKDSTQSKSIIWRDRILVFLLLFFSGNPLNELFGKYSILLFSFLVLLILKEKCLEALKNLNLFYFLLSLSIVFFLQNIVLGYVSWLGAGNMLLKVISSATVVLTIGKRFNSILFYIVSRLCMFSIVGFILFNILHLNIPSIIIGEYQQSYFLYGVTKFHPLKNEGMFWEPGAFAGIITLTLALNFTFLRSIWLYKKKELIFIILALITTQSTTGYLVTIIILSFSLLNTSKNVISRVIIIFVSAISFSISLISLDFLGEKISSQFKSAKEMKSNEFSNTRFGSMIFDWQYIKKHPLVGNGFDERTRYSDNREILDIIKYKEGDLGNGNGFSNFLASMGIPVMMLYFFLMYRNFIKVSPLYSTFFCLVVLLNLQGEQWLINGPIFLACPFIISYLKDPI